MHSQAIEQGLSEPEVIGRLRALCHERGLDERADALARIGGDLAPDMAAVEGWLARARSGTDPVAQSVGHLLDRPGKRLRPLCVMLAARLGQQRSGAVVDLAVAVELVHNATLLHDDVVDLGDVRRGAPTARAVYGNAASIFAGDWLLIEALRRVRNAGVPGTLERLLSVIEEMIQAEALQLERRGRLELDRAAYFKIVEGKTAALFRWAGWAGALCGGLDAASADALDAFGRELGMAFQLIDDALDLGAQTAEKTLFADLREGKLTYPLLVGCERDPGLVEHLRAALNAPVSEPVPLLLQQSVRASLDRTGSIAATSELAADHARRAGQALRNLAPCAARDALMLVAEAAAHRTR